METVESFDDDIEEDDVAVEEEKKAPPGPSKIDLAREEQQKLIKTLANKKPECLEDLYSMFPRLGDGTEEYFVRVDRVLPKAFHGVAIQGHQFDSPAKVTLDDIKLRLGGGHYRISIIGAVPGAYDSTDMPITKQLKYVMVQIPGIPVPHALADGNGNGNGMNRLQTVVPYGASAPQQPEEPRVRMKQIEVDAEREKRDHSEKEAARIQAQEITGRALDSFKEMMTTQMAQLQATIADQQKQIRERDTEIIQLTRQIADANSASATANMRFEELKGTKERLEHELTRSREDYSMRLSESEKRYREQIEDQRRRHDEEKTRLERDYMKERDRIHEDAKLRDQVHRDEAERRVIALKDQHEARIADLKQSLERDIHAMDQRAKVEVSAIKQTAETRVTLLESERNRIQGEYDRIHRQVEELRRAAHKDPMQFITEVKTIASEVFDWGPRAAGGSEEENEPKNWTQMAGRAVMTLIDKAPDMLAQVGQMRAQNAVAVQQQEMQRQSVLRQRQAQAQAQAQAQRRQQQMLPPGARPTPGAPGGVIAPMRAAPNRAYYPPPPPQVQQQQAPGEPMQPFFQQQQAPQQVAQQPMVQQPLQPGMPFPQPVAMPSQPPPSMAPVASPQPQVPFQQQSQQQRAEELQKYIPQFLEELDKAIREKVVPAGMFAEAAIERIGRERSHELISMIDPDELIERVEQISQDTAITTYDGKKYVHDLWTRARTVLGIQ